jgi:acyl dehydratase
MNIDAVKAWSRTVVHDYTARDAALYALSVGGVTDPIDAHQLLLVDEEAQITLPSMAAVIASPGFWARDEKAMEIDAERLVHGEQRIHLERPLPPHGRVTGISRVSRIVDKGAGKGALITVCKTLQSEQGELYGRAWQLFFCRGDGGFSADGKADLILDDHPLAPLVAAPARAPDQCIVQAVRSDAALLYRLNGDTNRLHIDAQAAQRAGFPRPILHGLATYGFAAVAAIRAFASDRAQTLKTLDARFTAPLYPGEEVEFRMWNEGSYVALEAHVAARNAVVLSHGRADFY